MVSSQHFRLGETHSSTFHNDHLLYHKRHDGRHSWSPSSSTWQNWEEQVWFNETFDVFSSPEADRALDLRSGTRSWRQVPLSSKLKSKPQGQGGDVHRPQRCPYPEHLPLSTITRGVHHSTGCLSSRSHKHTSQQMYQIFKSGVMERHGYDCQGCLFCYAGLRQILLQLITDSKLLPAPHEPR